MTWMMGIYFFSNGVFVVVADPFDPVVGVRSNGFGFWFFNGPIFDADFFANLVIGQISFLTCGFARFGRSVGRTSKIGQIRAGQFVGPSVSRNAQNEFVGSGPVEKINLNRCVLNLPRTKQ